jgi:SAM-dependent methyltransferase
MLKQKKENDFDMPPIGQRIRLHLGCGGKILPGWTNVDYHNPKADQKVDLFRYPWPWETSSVDEILMEQFLEHFPDLIEAVQEIHRVLKNGGTIRVVVPHARSVNAHAIGHETMFSYITFSQLSDNTEWFTHAHGCLFKTIKYRIRILKSGPLRWTPLDWIASRWPIFWEKASFSIFSPTEIEWIGEAIK